MPETSLDLPLFPKDMPLDIALRRLHAMHRAAGVFVLGGAFYLVSAAAMAGTRAMRRKEWGDSGVLTDVQARRVVKVHARGHVRLAGGVTISFAARVGRQKVSLIVPRGAGATHFDDFVNKQGHGRSVWEGVPDLSEGDFRGLVPQPGVLAGGGTMRFEHPRVDVAVADAAVLGLAPRDYYCDGPAEHDYFPPPHVNVGDPCPSGDKARVVSSK